MCYSNCPFENWYGECTAKSPLNNPQRGMLCYEEEDEEDGVDNGRREGDETETAD